MSTDIPANGLDLSPVFGPIYWGFVVSMLLGGITVLQGYIYFPRTQDRLSIQLTAGAMLVLDFASSALVAQSVYYYLVPHFGSLLPLNSITPELSAECLISTIITFISQLYFVKQLTAVTKYGKRSWVVPVVVGVCAACAFAFGVACTSVMFVHNHSVLADRSHTFAVFFGLAKGFGAITDIFATIAMCILLSSARTGMGGTNSILKQLMHFVIHRGALVTLIQTLLLIMFFAAPAHLYWLAFHVNVTKLYVNVFFAMLNARTSLNEKQRQHTVMTMSSQSHSRHGRDNKIRLPGSPQVHDVRAVEEYNEGKSYSVPLAPMPTVTKSIVVSDR